MDIIDRDKIEIQKQWDKDQCGASTVKNLSPGTIEYFRAIRKYRYNDYGVWFKNTIGFDKFKNIDILEIGVGLGSDHYSFAVNGNAMTALDLSREHLKSTVLHLSLEGLSTNAVYGDAESMPFQNATFDVVYSFGVLHHTPNTERAFAEIHRVLRPGGTAIIGLYHRNSIFYWLMVVFVSGILKMGFLRKGVRRVLSEIEYRVDSDSAAPLVKIYSRRQVKKMFRAFSSVDVCSCHVEASHFWRLSKIMSVLFSRGKLERLFGHAGWYLIIKATK